MAEKHLSPEVLHKLSLLKLSATIHHPFFTQKEKHLADLRTHFSLLTLEDDEVVYLEPKYWYSSRNLADIAAWALIIGMIGWVLLISFGVL